MSSLEIIFFCANAGDHQLSKGTNESDYMAI